ncbi:MULTISPECIES: hypothetical protein [unclassified Moorena]|nr:MULTISPECIES: hypothetical protein [unclassified Moorena]NEO16213.1 hypothetical protein [Moorena sp. SIO3E8]NEQ02742.1 hypothetical protein [Moorena sp. SIO3F7]
MQRGQRGFPPIALCMADRCGRRFRTQTQNHEGMHQDQDTDNGLMTND